MPCLRGLESLLLGNRPLGSHPEKTDFCGYRAGYHATSTRQNGHPLRTPSARAAKLQHLTVSLRLSPHARAYCSTNSPSRTTCKHRFLWKPLGNQSLGNTCFAVKQSVNQSLLTAAFLGNHIGYHSSAKQKTGAVDGLVVGVTPQDLSASNGWLLRPLISTPPIALAGSVAVPHIAIAMARPSFRPGYQVRADLVIDLAFIVMAEARSAAAEADWLAAAR